MKTDNNYEPYGSAGTNEEIVIDDLAPPLSITEAARAAKKFIATIPKNIIDVDIGNGL